MSKRVLVTGVGGFAGRYLTPLFASTNYTVSGMVAHENELPWDSVADVHSADLRQIETVRNVVQTIQPTHVVHLAAISFVAHGDIGEIYETNVVGTRNLLQSLSELPVAPQSVLLVSSANVYGNAEVQVLTERDTVRPANDYAVSKIAMEYMSNQFSDKLPIVTCRPFNYTGHGQALAFLVPKIVDHFRRRSPTIELGNLDIVRDFSDVRTVVDAMKRLVETPSAVGQVFNICSGHGYSLRSIVETCQKITGHNIAIEVNPKFVRESDVKVLTGSPAKLRKTIGASEEIPFEQTLAWMLSA